MHVEKYNSSLKDVFLHISLCFNLFVIGQAVVLALQTYVRHVILMLGGGGGVSEHYQTTMNFVQEPGFLDCVAGSSWSSNIFLYQALFGLLQKMSIAVSKS